MRVPEKTMAVVLGEGMLHKRHKYNEMNEVTTVRERSCALNKATFGIGKPQPPSTDLSGISSSSAAPSYYSPAFNIGEAGTDLSFLEAKRGDPRVDERRTMLSSVCVPLHHFIMRAKKPDGQIEERWYAPIYSFSRSCALLWPVSVEPIRNKNLAFVDFEFLVPEPVARPVTDWRDWLARPCTWTSWKRLLDMYPSAVKGLKPGIKMIAGEECVLLELAAKKARFKYSLPQLVHIATFHGITIPQGSDMCTAMKAMIMNVLHIDEKAALEIIKIRFATFQPDSGVETDLLEVDEAVKFLDAFDMEEIKKSKGEVQKLEESFQKFAQEYQEQVKKLPMQGSSRTDARRQGAGGRDARVPKRIPSTDARKFCPPGASIWVSRLDLSACYFDIAV